MLPWFTPSSAVPTVYSYLKRMGRDQLRSIERGGRLSITAALARMTERIRRRGPGPGPSQS